MINHQKEFNLRVTKDWQDSIKNKLSLAKFKTHSRSYERDGMVITLVCGKGCNRNTEYKNSTIEENYYQHLLTMYLQLMSQRCLYTI